MLRTKCSDATMAYAEHLSARYGPRTARLRWVG
jgi:hypothetical protein